MFWSSRVYNNRPSVDEEQTEYNYTTAIGHVTHCTWVVRNHFRHMHNCQSHMCYWSDPQKSRVDIDLDNPVNTCCLAMQLDVPCWNENVHSCCPMVPWCRVPFDQDFFTHQAQSLISFSHLINHGSTLIYRSIPILPLQFNKMPESANRLMLKRLH